MSLLSFASMMQRRRALLCIFVLGLVPAGFGQKQETPSEYASLLARVKNGDLSVDYKQLRFSYMESPERRHAKDTSKEGTEMWVALNKKDYSKAVENADVVLASNFVNMDAQLVEYIAYRELQNDSLSSFHKSVFARLLKSITDSGDGNSMQTAYVVISVDEEYVVLRFRGLRARKQSVAHEGGHSYDVMEAFDPESNKTLTLYFNVDIPFKHYLD
jgi:hypothetical protein